MSKVEYRPIDTIHADGLLPIWSDAEVIKYTNMKLPCTMEDVQSRITNFKAFDVLTVVKDDEIIGVIGCPPVNKEANEYGIFYQFRRASWGQGNATAAAGWLIGFMKEKYGSFTLLADVVAENTASEKILLGIGFIQLSEEFIERNGNMVKVHNFRLKV